MNKEEFQTEKEYLLSVSIIKSMVSQDVILQETYDVLRTKLVEKYRPILGTLFADISLTFGAKRVMYSSERKRLYAENKQN